MLFIKYRKCHHLNCFFALQNPWAHKNPPNPITLGQKGILRIGLHTHWDFIAECSKVGRDQLRVGSFLFNSFITNLLCAGYYISARPTRKSLYLSIFSYKIELMVFIWATHSHRHMQGFYTISASVAIVIPYSRNNIRMQVNKIDNLKFSL